MIKHVALILTGLTMLIAIAKAAFFPLKVEEKSKKADLIIMGDVKKIIRIIGVDDSMNTGAHDEEGSYLGPHSVALVEVKEVWSSRMDKSDFVPVAQGKYDLPKHILIPCHYPLEESPSDFLKGNRYVFFLESLKHNLFHPINPDAWYTVHENRVADIGDSYPDEHFAAKSMPLDKFKQIVLKAASTSAEALDDQKN